MNINQHKNTKPNISSHHRTMDVTMDEAMDETIDGDATLEMEREWESMERDAMERHDSARSLQHETTLEIAFMAKEDQLSHEYQESRYYEQFDQESRPPLQMHQLDQLVQVIQPQQRYQMRQLRAEGQGAHQAPEVLNHGMPIGIISQDHLVMHHGTNRNQQLPPVQHHLERPPRQRPLLLQVYQEYQVCQGWQAGEPRWLTSWFYMRTSVGTIWSSWSKTNHQISRDPLTTQLLGRGKPADGSSCGKARIGVASNNSISGTLDFI